jgi:hypothetical protein
VALEVLEQDRVAVDDGGEEVPLLARVGAAAPELGGLDQCAGGVGRDHVAVRECVLPHRVHDRRAQGVTGLLDIPAHRPSIQRDTLIGEILLEPVVRHPEPELRHDHVRDRRRV